jgi:hypothetical protein
MAEHAHMPTMVPGRSPGILRRACACGKGDKSCSCSGRARLHRSLGSLAAAPALGHRFEAVRVAHSAEPGALQPALMVGAADDPLEREAERIADEIMRMPDDEKK